MKTRGFKTLSVAAAFAVLAVACTGSDDDDAGGEGDGGQRAIDVGPQGYGAVITRTTGGVPHIHAESLDGVSFGQGWASAEDHPCDLVDQVIKIHSQRAATFGPGEDGEYIESDFGWAALGLVDVANADWAAVEDDVRGHVEAFTAGWNASLEAQGVDGIEDWCRGAEWMRPVTAEEVHAYARSVALLASGARLIDFIAAAQPPGSSAEAGGQETALATTDLSASSRASLASNGWAVGSELTENGSGALIGNPHFPWIGELRFSEVHLSTEDGINVYGAQLLGLPGVGIGFTEGVAWTHTVSAGKRFTAYQMELAPGDPTSYVIDGEAVPMDSREITIEVLGDDGTTTPATRTYWSTEFGPVLDFPGVGWTDTATVSYRDANLANDRTLPQYAAMMRAGSLEELRDAHEEYQGVPLFNTVAVGSDGTTWYADTSATPNLSPEAIEAYEARLELGGLTKLAAESNAVLLEGNTSRDRWVDDPAAPWPGVIPWSGLPGQERSDYVMNANDSYWIANSAAPIDGDFSPLQGSADTARSVRTRQNLAVLDLNTPDMLAGDDELFSGDELRAAALHNGAYTTAQWLEGVVQRCNAATAPVASEELLSGDGEPVVAPTEVDLSRACAVLEAWDGLYNADSQGPVLWREFTEQVTYGDLWAVPFDAASPADTPNGLGPAVVDGADQVLLGLANAVALLDHVGIALDAPLGEIQYDARVQGVRNPVPGGLGGEGITNVVSDGQQAYSTVQPQPDWPERLVAGSTLTEDGYPVTYGSSFMLAVEFGDDGPQGHSILTYGQVGDESSPLFDVGVKEFAAKQWKPALFTPEAVASDPSATVTNVSG